MKLNYKLLTKNNLILILRFLGILLVPVLSYFSLEFQDLKSWATVWDVFVKFISTPYIFILTAINFFLMIPVSITEKGIEIKEEIENAPVKAAAVNLKKGGK